nr:EOG090X0D00 [Artemia franciscana]
MYELKLLKQKTRKNFSEVKMNKNEQLKVLKVNWPGHDKKKHTKRVVSLSKFLKQNFYTKRLIFDRNIKLVYVPSARGFILLFTGSKAVDALMESKWVHEKKEGAIPTFPNRTAVTDYLDLMLRYKFFHRAKKIAVSDVHTKKKRKDEKKEDIKEETKVEKEEKKEDDKGLKRRSKSAKSEAEEEEKKGEDAESSQGEGKPKEGYKKEGGGKIETKKRKIRLDMHLEQIFLDSSDAYVWIYDPIPLWYWAAGTLVVLATIGFCLFPLWPPTLRKGVYYLSLAGAGFLLFILGLAVLRFILFCLIWIVSLGKHHFWLLPNLTEDVGFFASFWPLYQYEYKGKSKIKSKKKKKKAKDSDAEDENDDTVLGEEDKNVKESKQNAGIKESVEDIKERYSY